MIKRKGKSKIETLDDKSLESRGQMRFNWDVLYIVRNIFSKAIKYCPCIFNIDFTLKKMSIQIF